MSLPTDDQTVLLLHNPRCSKSRATLALLEERGIAHETREYLEHPLGAEELAELAVRLGKPAIAWTRTRETAFAEAGLAADASDADVFAAMAAHPILMERPIVVRGQRAAIGRPPEGVLALFE